MELFPIDNVFAMVIWERPSPHPNIPPLWGRGLNAYDKSAKNKIMIKVSYAQKSIVFIETLVYRESDLLGSVLSIPCNFPGEARCAGDWQ
jgi:hypothetical protein